MLDKYKAVIWGLAIGDALGAPTEFKGLDRIRECYGPDGIQHVNQTDGRFTDDTQMTVALAEGLLDAAADCNKAELDHEGPMIDPDFVMPHVAKQFVEWAFGPDNDRAPGNTCMAGCRALRQGKPWTESGVKTSKGCGSAMRSSPVGLIYSGQQLEDIARASSVVTHGHQAAVDAAHAAALAVRLLLDGMDPVEMAGEVFKQCAQDEHFSFLLSSVLPLVGATDRGEIEPEVAQTRAHLGESWTGDEAVASALYCFLLAVKRGEGYVETVRYGANTSGDSDSIAAIAGSLAGARWGIGGERGIPLSWIKHVEDSAELGLLAQR
ncbi:MAG TPA: ADP-ribosylglycohydrolase family protein, partial [Thermoleophilia bacterium]|nr:ADP-ribosylglycohydrolase family protein [Thermoleophilia bacterium]